MTIEFHRTGPGPLSPDATEHMVRMRDGVHLATDVYLPAGDVTPGPTVLTRLPYDKTGEYTFMPRVAAWFTARGYRVVVQDVRGKFRSEGETLLFVNEAYDGYDTIEWITHQQWSDGVVGMWGDSYYGYTQWAAASSAHPALRAMVPRVTGTRLGELPVPAPGERTHDVEMSIHRFYPLSMFHDRDILEWELDWTRRPLADAVEEFFQAVGSRSPSYDLWFPHPVKLRRFPAGSPFDAPAVPVLLTIGWWDNCAPWQWSDYRELTQRPAWLQNTFLLLEAIDHENNSHFNPAAPRNSSWMDRYLTPAAEFFDVFLRGNAATIPRVRWQLANSGDTALRSAQIWPPAGVRVTQLHPHPDRTLLLNPASSPTEETWTHDASSPVQSPVRDPFSFLAESPDERDLATHPDVLSFTAAPVTEPLDLAGPITLTATVGSDGPEMDLFARLADVAPDGATHLIARGQQTILDPGRAFEVRIDLGQIGYRLHPGHALRLTLASSDAPEFVPVPGTGEHRWLAATTKPNHQHVLLGGPAGCRLAITVR
ncbi:CocE/NonD family hydrolase [Paractinoplanes durhamensis]|uniref:Hydrolase n=1 Tax=Paractinoplanes durhamensis TaxID=113563 RepID=A0ABQ3YVJ6_9ACTN|nr:CocE/NonD family hydrolase [Actinoplanes durhamensis]GIE01625.1 hydrolase [Actinoplanes durhamensis]